jgi:hypothetical protein
LFLIEHVSRLLSQFGHRWMPLFDPRAESPFTCVTRLVEFLVTLSALAIRSPGEIQRQSREYLTLACA